MSRNFLVAFVYVLLMGLNYPIVRYISLYFDGSTNNAFRFATGGLILLAITTASAKYRRQYWYLWQRKQYLFRLLALCVFNTLGATLFVLGLKNTSAVTASLFGIIGMPVTILIVALFFVDERKKALRFKFFLGSTIAILASIVFVLAGNGNSDAQGNFILGVIFFTVNIFVGACSSLFIKGIAGRIHPFVVTCITNIFSSSAFAITKFIDYKITGQAADLAAAQWWHLVGVSLIGLIATFLGILYVQIIKTQGVIIYNILQLIIPLATAVISFYILGESINLLQILSALFVIAGCVIAVLLKDQHARALAVPRVVANPESVAKVALAAAHHNRVFDQDSEANLVASKVNQALGNERSLTSSHTLASSKEILAQLGLDDKVMQISTPEAQLAKYTSVADIQTLAAQLKEQEVSDYLSRHNLNRDQWQSLSKEQQEQLLAAESIFSQQNPNYQNTVATVTNLIAQEIASVKDLVDEKPNNILDTTLDPHLIDLLQQAQQVQEQQRHTSEQRAELETESQISSSTLGRDNSSVTITSEVTQGDNSIADANLATVSQDNQVDNATQAK